MSAAKRKGSAFEAQVVSHLQEHGCPELLRQHQRAGDPMSPEPPGVAP